ncbi:MAG: SDR family oxidoreductase [Beijerinckiaceae bacterium]|nr:SDR family oxidoreductase [Beijerinckiaceae bacterium]
MAQTSAHALKSLSEISLEGRAAIVTGAARGLGRAMAFALCGAGADVVFLDIDADEADRVAHEAAGLPGAGRAMGLACDIRNLAQCRTAVARTIEAFGALHILENNAAHGPTHVERALGTKSALFHEADPQAWADVIEVNVTGTFFMAHAAAHALIASGWGRIINITTSLATMQRGANSPYGVTKAAIEAETLIWAQDLKGTGVTVNSLIPGGAADTDFVSARGRAAIAKTGRALLDPQVMIAPLLWLCSQEADAVTAARYVGKLWDEGVSPAQAARGALEPPVLRTPDRD